VDCLFFVFESLLRLFQQWKNGKNTETVAIAVTKRPAKFWIKKFYRKKSPERFCLLLLLLLQKKMWISQNMLWLPC